jgi:hypothetical protein
MFKSNNSKTQQNIAPYNLKIDEFIFNISIRNRKARSYFSYIQNIDDS